MKKKTRSEPFYSSFSKKGGGKKPTWVTSKEAAGMRRGKAGQDARPGGRVEAGKDAGNKSSRGGEDVGRREFSGGGRREFERDGRSGYRETGWSESRGEGESRATREWRGGDRGGEGRQQAGEWGGSAPRREEDRGWGEGRRDRRSGAAMPDIVRPKGKRRGNVALPTEEDCSPDAKAGEWIGTLRVLRSGRAFVVPSLTGQSPAHEGRPIPEEIPLEKGATGTGLDGDLVKVRMSTQRPVFGRRGRVKVPAGPASGLGRVIGVVKRNRMRIVGIYQRNARAEWIECVDAGLPSRVNLTRSEGKVEVNPQPGQWCVVEIGDWRDPARMPMGKVLEVLGWQDDPGCDIRVIMAKHQIAHRFADDILDAAEAISQEIEPEERLRREDWTALPVITIDPATAKDHDDAVWLRQLDDGGWELAVHIADVAHYVHPGSSLDREARDRGNSTYLVDRVVPMLPARLSNNLCSLREGEERLAKAAVMKFDAAGRRTAYRFCDTLVKVVKRLSYEEAMDVLEGKEVAGVSGEVAKVVRLGGELSQLLRQRRFRQGSLDLDMPKVQVVLDENGKPVALKTDKTDPSHQLIEEFMLAANEAVAHSLRQRSRPSIHRIHEDPDDVRLEEFQETAKLYGFEAGDITQRQHLQELIGKIKGSHEEQALMLGLLKSLKRARYSADPEGHFGLAMSDYCHFTSPIRRYADVIVHRALDAFLDNPPPRIARPLPKGELDEIASHISETERQSADAEQESQKVKMLEYLALQAESGHAEELEAMVIEVKPIGVMIEVPALQIRGMVKKSDFPRNRWFLDESNRRWQSFDGKQVRVGDTVKVAPKQIDFIRMLADFEMVELAQTHRELPGIMAPGFGRQARTRNRHGSTKRRRH